MLRAGQSRKCLTIENGKFLANSFNDSFDRHESAFVLNVGRLGVHVLIGTRSPPFVASIDFNEESFEWVLVPEEQEFI
jgi:hypothetical protein